MASTRVVLRAFFESYPVSTLEDVRNYLSFGRSSRAASDMIQHNKNMGREGMIKQGLYYVVHPGQKTHKAPVDPFLLASKLTSDAVLAFHTALDVQDYGHSVFNTHYCFSDRYRQALHFPGADFRVVATPQILRKKSANDFGTENVERVGVKFVVTGKERTLLECLEKPQYCGGFEEMYRSLERIPNLQSEGLLAYLELREQKNLYARVGFFLEQHREDLQVEDSLLHQLARRVPAEPVYWTRKIKGGVLAKPWNLIVPESVRDRRWEDR